MMRRKGLYRYEGYLAFRLAAEIHEALFPGKPVDGGTRKMSAIFRGLSKAYTDGIEDALQQGDEWIRHERKRISVRDRDC
jgi:hypothetical protein